MDGGRVCLCVCLCGVAVVDCVVWVRGEGTDTTQSHTDFILYKTLPDKTHFKQKLTKTTKHK